MTRPLVLSIDDDESEVAPNVDTDQFDLLVVAPDDADLSKTLTEQVGKATLVLLDQKFNNEPAALSLTAQDGASFVSHLRSWSRATGELLPPIVLFTNEEEAFKNEIPAVGAALPLKGSFVGREHQIAPTLDVEWIQHKASELAQMRIEQLVYASSAIHEIAGTDGVSLKEIEQLLDLPTQVVWAERAREEIRDARPPVSQAEIGTHEKQRGSSQAIIRWLCHRALPFPGLFLSDLYAAWALGVSLPEFEKIADADQSTEWLKALSQAEYNGPLDIFVGRRWWRAGIDHLVYLLDSASTKRMPRKDVFSGFVPGLDVQEVRSSSSHVVTWTPTLTEGAIASMDDAVQLKPPGWPAEALDPWIRKEDTENDEVLQAMIDSADLQ